MPETTTPETGKRERPKRRRVPADLFEATPNGLGYWLLASPFILFLFWFWLDLFTHYSPLPKLADWLLAIPFFLFLIVLPFGLLAHGLITALPRLFNHAGWDLQPLEPVSEAEMYLVHYTYTEQHRAENNWRRVWLRAAQGWVYLEITAIFAGAILMIPIFLSVSEFGFGR